MKRFRSANNSAFTRATKKSRLASSSSTTSTGTFHVEPLCGSNLQNRSIPVVSRNSDDEEPPSVLFERLVTQKVEKMVEKYCNQASRPLKSVSGEKIIPTFDPDNQECNVKNWLAKIDQLGLVHQWDDYSKIVIMQTRLTGQAQLWFTRLEEYNYTWEQWKTLLTNAFPRSFEYADMLEELVTRKKLHTETITRYYHDKLAMCRRCRLDDSASLSCLIKGLPSELQNNAKAYKCETPEEFYTGYLSAFQNYRIKTDIKKNDDETAAKSSNVLGAASASSLSASNTQEDEKKENNNEIKKTPENENKFFISIDNSTNYNSYETGRDSFESPVITRSQIKVDSLKTGKTKSVKKTVTFGAVESCDDIFPLKKLPLKQDTPLVPIIKKNSALKPTEYSSFSSILKPAKLTDLSSKSASKHPEGYTKKNLNPLSKFSNVGQNRCVSPPPPRNCSQLLLRSAQSSRIAKPIKRLIDWEDQSPGTNRIVTGKVLKTAKLKRVVFNKITYNDDNNVEKSYVIDRTKNKPTSSSSRLFKDNTSIRLSNLNSIARKPHEIFSYEKDSDEKDEVTDLKVLGKFGIADKEEDKVSNEIRKLMDLSDGSSSSSATTFSESESEESWESDSFPGGGEVEVKPPSLSLEKEKPAPSQLMRGKVIIREARLQLNSPVQATTNPDGPFSALTSATSGNPPATVTCGVCGAVRFYRFVKQARKFGIYSCESCRKFISKMLKKEKLTHKTGSIVMQCLKGEGNCHVPPIVRSQQWKLLKCTNKARCPACWLKLCLKAFQVPVSIRSGLTAMLPEFMREGAAQSETIGLTNPLKITRNVSPVQPVFTPLSNNESENIFGSLKTTKKSSEEIEKVEEKALNELSAVPAESEAENSNRKRRLTRIKLRKQDSSILQKTEDAKRQKLELKGPRIKHVCRSASIVLGQLIATFPTQEEKEKLDKTTPDESLTVPIEELEKVELTLHLGSESESEIENKHPKPEPAAITTEPDLEITDERKKKKTESLVPIKVQNKFESSEDKTVMDLIPKKTVRPLTTVTNVFPRVNKCGQNRPELICVDFWESYDPDEVCNSGFGLIGTAAFTVTRVCFLCGSAGREKMLVCSSCCEWYHDYCAEEPAGAAGWQCARCVTCAACARSAARLCCRSCGRQFHAGCLPAPPHDHRSDWPQICSACLRCKSCESSRVTKFVGSLPFCGPCFKLRQKGNYCPLCQACYRDNDFDSKMMECGWCGRWVHASCEGLTGEGYQLLSALPPSIEYICCKCMPEDPPWRKMLTEHLKARLLHLLKCLAKNKNACALLKLTPHKHMPNKFSHIMSPQAIRKLHFESDDPTMTSDTKVYRNTTRGKRTNTFVQNNLYDPSATEIWNYPSMFSDSDSGKKGMPHTSHKVVNLQEPLMQNKEICFSTGLYGTKTEYDIPCIEVLESYTPQNRTEKAITMLPTTVHDNKYEAISDDDESTKVFLQDRSEQDLSPALARPTMEENLRIMSPSLLDIKKRVNSDEYISLKDFNHDMKDVIERTSSKQLKIIYKDLFSETFPWFDCENNCLQPNLEVEGEQSDTDSGKDQEISNIKNSVLAVERPLEQIALKVEYDGDKIDEDLLECYPTVDSRTCVLCKITGDGASEMEGRLLYCGQNDWIHVNCAIWSAEVYEEIDGSLQNVHSAISRGKMIKCAACEVKGASVGCCAKNCSETFHYMCARREGCAFMDDKRVFCPAHGKDVPKRSLQKDADFKLTRPVYVELDKKKKRYSEISKVFFLLGSLTVHNLGKIVPSVSDFEDFLIPVDFSCTRLFWSCKKPAKIVRYTIKTKLLLAEPLPGFDFGVNITVDHSMDAQVVDRVIAEIGAWYESFEADNAKNSCFNVLQCEKSPSRSGNIVTLEEIAVKQVVEYLLDHVCKQEQQDEEEPQNTADLLPPELKDAIFEDLNHDLLDGISMQDIFPNPYEDLVAVDLRNEFYSAISQSDEKSSDKSDFIDELLHARLESGSKEIKRSKSDMLLQNHCLKALTIGRGSQRSSTLTGNNRFDTTLLSSTIKRCKMGRTSTVTGKFSPIQKHLHSENPLDILKSTGKRTESGSAKKLKIETTKTDSLGDEATDSSGITYLTTSPKADKEESEIVKFDKTESQYDFIDFYTKIQCSPISQLDGAEDCSGTETCSSRPNIPQNNWGQLIQQLDGAEDTHKTLRNQNNQLLLRSSENDNTNNVAIQGHTNSDQLIIRPLDEGPGTSGQIEQFVRCDRCHCTYRNKESYDRHVPSCDIMSTSESESENPKSPENKILTTLQNVLQNAQPVIIQTDVVNGSENTVKTDSVSDRRTSINTRQITINGTIVETQSPGLNNEMTVAITEQMKAGTVIFDQSRTNNVHVSTSQQIFSSPQIVVTPQIILPPKNNFANSQKIVTPKILPYNICVKPSNANNNIQHIQCSTDAKELFQGLSGNHVISSSSNQVLAIPSNPSGNIATRKNQVTNFSNLASAPPIALPLHPVHVMPNKAIIQNIQPLIRPQMQSNSVVVPTITDRRLLSPNSHNKQQLLLPGTPQKSPKKQPTPFQHKPMLQVTNRARTRPVPKPSTYKRQMKLEKTFATMNQSPIGAGNTAIQLQANNQTGQPSIIVQPVVGQNIMSAYVEALTQQHNHNMQYIATISPQAEFKTGSTQFITQSNLVPQTFQIQQTDSGGLVAVPSGAIPVLLPQGNVGILPQTIQQGATILPQGAIQAQGIISQGSNGPTILPQTIHTQNGATLLPQNTIQGLNTGNLNSQTTFLPNNNTVQTTGATVVAQSGIGNGQTTIIPSSLQSQGSTLISSSPGTPILPQGTILPHLCNDQVLLGSTPTLEMVTDPSGCMYLTTTQPVFYGLETIVQNTVMSSQQFVSSAMQGVLSQNSSFSATTTQVFQASKIEPFVEVPTGYVVVNNVGDRVTVQSSTPNIVTSVQSSAQKLNSPKSSIPNLTLKPLPDKQTQMTANDSNWQTSKVVQISLASTPAGSQSGIVTSERQNINPVTPQLHNMTLSSVSRNLHRTGVSNSNIVTMSPNAKGQPVMAISQSIENPSTAFTMSAIPISQSVVSSSIEPPVNRNTNIERPHKKIAHDENLNSPSVSTANVTPNVKSPVPWRQITTTASNYAKINLQNVTSKTSASLNTPSISIQSNVVSGRALLHNDPEKSSQHCVASLVNSSNQMSCLGMHPHQLNIHVSHHSLPNSTSNNVIQITAGNIYGPASVMNSNFDADTSIKLSKINALLKTDGGHLNFSQHMSSHRQQNDKNFQNNSESVNKMNNSHVLESCQIATSTSCSPADNIIPRNLNTISGSDNQNQECSVGKSSSHGQFQILNSGNSSLNSMNISYQNLSNKKNNVATSNDNSIREIQQHSINTVPISTMNMTSVGTQIILHQKKQISAPNRIQIMNGQIQQNLHSSSNQLQKINSENCNTSLTDSLGSEHQQQIHNQVDLFPSRNTADSSHIINQSVNQHIHRTEINEINHPHMQETVTNMSTTSNNRIMLDNLQVHNVKNVTHQRHSNNTLENMHITQLNIMQPMNNNINADNHPQVNNNMFTNQQMTMQPNGQIDSHYIMSLQNSRANIENMHHQVLLGQMHNLPQMDNSMHIHQVPSISMNIQQLGDQTDNSGSYSNPNIHSSRREDPVAMQNLINHRKTNQITLDNHPSIMQHSTNNLNNLSMPDNANNIMQMNNTQLNNRLGQHIPNIPEIKTEVQSSCSGSCANNSKQFPNSQSSFNVCTNMNSGNNTCMSLGKPMHSVNANNMRMTSHMMMNNVNSSGLYQINNQSNLNSHDILMSCNNSPDQSSTNLSSGNTNHLLMNNSQVSTGTNQNQILCGPVTNNALQINIGNCSLNANNSTHNRVNNLEKTLLSNIITVNDGKYNQDTLRSKEIVEAQAKVNVTSSECAKITFSNDMQSHTVSINNQIGYMQMNSQGNRVISLPERNTTHSLNTENNLNELVQQQHHISLMASNTNSVRDPATFEQETESTGTMINVPFQAIPNNAPMNINVNSGNNTVNITVQNNLVVPKMTSKSAGGNQINLPIQANTNMLQNQKCSSSIICIPVQNNTINLPTQNCCSITLPKAPPTQQSGIPTNVVNPMTMRPMNRVLPLHRDGQSKNFTKTSTVTKDAALIRLAGQDMPDLNIKDETIHSDLEKEIGGSKCVSELERVKREKEEADTIENIQLSTDITTEVLLTSAVKSSSNETEDMGPMENTPKTTSLPSLDDDITDVDIAKILVEKERNKIAVSKKSSNTTSKVMKRPLVEQKSESDPIFANKPNKILKENKFIKIKPIPELPKDDGPKLMFEVSSEDGFNYSSSSLTDLWSKVVETVRNARKQSGLSSVKYNLPSSSSGAHLIGLNNNALRYLIEQLPGANRCIKYKIKQGRQLSSRDNDLDLSEGFKASPWGSARTGPVTRKQTHDMFSWMASPFREEPPSFSSQEAESSISRRLATLPSAMRFRQLKDTAKASVGVYRSHIHGRGLFCKREIEEGDMVIEYAGEVIRAILADQREKKYEATSGRRGVGGCYMFRIDDNLVVDATRKGNAARFINHSCDPNCYSRVVDIHGHKHILIFALRRISVGEELTYDYKFPFEEVKIPCTCGAKKCRKYLN